MESEDDVWRPLLESVKKRRSHDARFYKPVCLYAAASLIDEEALDPADIKLEAIQSRFSELVHSLFPDRAQMGWRPFWHLSNDGAWSFTKAGKRVEPSNFGVARKPDSIGQLLSRFDKVSVPNEMTEIWADPAHRRALKDRVVAILASDPDDDCKLIAAQFRNAATGTVASMPLEETFGQGFEPDPIKRKVIEDRAMTVAANWLTARGWTVSDVSQSRSYDLHCVRGAESLFVEVKGTRSSGNEIILTVAEKKLAEQDPASMALFIVSSILITASRGGYAATNGDLKIIHPWSPDVHDLRPIAYKCVLRQTDHVSEI